MDGNQPLAHGEVRQLVKRLDAIERQLGDITELLNRNLKAMEKLQKVSVSSTGKKLEEPQTVTAGSTVIVRM